MRSSVPTLPPIHIALMQPAGQVHALGLLDPARYLRHQLRRFGTEVTLAKNRLREDALNIVFGAHLGFAAEWAERHACVFFNLEQLGDGGATLDATYVELLRRSAVADYDAANRAAYAPDPNDVPVVPILHAPYLERADDVLPLEARPIDLLFFGTMNERRRAFIERVEACGVTVATFDQPVYGEERDAFVRQAKAVLNCHYYASSRFEQARVAQCLSLGTPVIAERASASSMPHAAFEDAVFWLDGDGKDFERFFREHFATPSFFDDARARLEAWRAHDPVEPYADLMAFAAGVFQAHLQQRSGEPWRPPYVNLGSGKDYKPGWLNLDVIDRAEPDLVLDLAQPVQWPLRHATRFGGDVWLEAGSVQAIYANNVLEHVGDLPMLMGNALALLEEGGLFEIEVPYEKAPTAWQDPTHVRALNEKSWRYYTDWFWYLGWFEHRFEIAASGWMDSNLRDCAQHEADFMRVTLRKVATTAHERTVARTMRADFGGLPDDLPSDEHKAPRATDEAPKLVVVDEARDATPAAPTASATTTSLLADALPAARCVLELGPASASLETAWRARHDVAGARWTRVDSVEALAAGHADERFDLIVLAEPIDAWPDPVATLSALRTHAAPAAALWLTADNRASWEALGALIEGDCDDVAPRRFSVATLTRLLLDSGWLPQLAAHQRVDHAAGSDVELAASALALAHQVPPATLQRVLSVDRFAMQAVPAPVAARADGGPARFTVLVPTTRDGQFRRNVKASPGLHEVQARIVTYRGAAHPAEALEQSLEHCDTEWVLFAHQDVYFPRGFGERLNALLAGIPAHERQRTLIGFAGVGVDRDSARTAPAGLVIDRTSRFDHPPSGTAVSIDELAIVVARDSVHRIDPALGWHLWATDLCLTAIAQHRCFARIVRLQVFHNSSNDYTLSEAFHRSAELLAVKHAGFGPIATLCGTIDAPPLVAAA